MTTIIVKCRCPRGHEVKSSFTNRNPSIHYDEIEKEFVGSKIQDYCRGCCGVQPLLIMSIVSMDDKDERRVDVDRCLDL